jgi:hypothetical protein
MSYLKSSNLLMACLLSAKAGFLLISPVEAATNEASPQTALNSPIEVEVVNLKVHSSDRTGDLMLVADADTDQTQDYDQTQDVDQNQARQIRQIPHA